MDRRLQELAAMGEIAQEIVHELRNALLVISASTYLAQKHPAGAGPHLQKIERHTRVAQGIVERVHAVFSTGVPYRASEERALLVLQG